MEYVAGYWPAAGGFLVAFGLLSGCFLVVCCLLWLLCSYECFLLRPMICNILWNMLCDILWNIWPAAGCLLLAFLLLFGCLLLAVALAVIRKLLAVVYVVEYVLGYIEQSFVGYLTLLALWLLSVRFLVAFWLFALCCGSCAPTNAICCGI
jgi:hypothetical protein